MEVPLRATLQENERLRREVFDASSKMETLRYKVMELTKMQDKSVQQFLDEFYELKENNYQLNTRLSQLEDIERRSEVNAEDLTRQLSTCKREKEAAENEIHALQVRVDDLVQELDSARHRPPYTLDDLKRDDTDWTLRSDTDNNETARGVPNVTVAQLEDEVAKLKEELAMTNREKDTTKTLLVEILKKYGELKKTTEMSIDISNCSRDELMGEVENVHCRLMELRDANRHIRATCRILRNLNPDEESSLTEKCVTNRNADKTEVDKTNLEPEAEQLIELIRMKGMLDESIFSLLKQSEESRFVNMNETSGEPKAVLQISMLNTSIQGMLNFSHNASINVAQFKEKMTMCRELVQQMFDRLKASAALFEEIQIRLGGGSDELVERLDAMQLNWRDISLKKKKVFEAITETETSVAELQLHLSLVEQTFNMEGTVGAGDVSLLEKLSMTRANGKDTQELIETKEKLEQMTSELREAYASRDIAQETVDKLRATISMMEEDMEEARETMSNLQASERKLLSENQSIMKRNEDCLLAIKEMNQQLEERKAEVCRFEEAVNKADRKIDDMEMQLKEAEKKNEEIAVIGHGIMNLKNELDRQLEEETKLQVQLEEAKKTSDGLCLEMKQVVREKDLVTERLEQEKESKRLIKKQLKEAREQLQVRVDVQLEAQSSSLKTELEEKKKLLEKANADYKKMGKEMKRINKDNMENVESYHQEMAVIKSENERLIQQIEQLHRQLENNENGRQLPLPEDLKKKIRAEVQAISTVITRAATKKK